MENKELLIFQKRLDNMKLHLERDPSLTNPSLLKDSITTKDIAEEMNSKYGLDMQAKDVKMEKEIIKFGEFIVDVEEFFFEKYEKKFSFKIRIIIKPHADRQPKEGTEKKSFLKLEMPGFEGTPRTKAKAEETAKADPSIVGSKPIMEMTTGGGQPPAEAESIASGTIVGQTKEGIEDVKVPAGKAKKKVK
eukprot:TRINITY_DN4753_c0_g3_i1.p1 TRINITY_DN4753_c0_g3~~TRINITY_DN4753_c0_g3_i1.p1  ORF type:complete len:191 (+),score=47.25 TRINITY_DN4753_c0_g3_i1:264-836(+)